MAFMPFTWCRAIVSKGTQLQGRAHCSYSVSHSCWDWNASAYTACKPSRQDWQPCRRHIPSIGCLMGL